MKKFIALSIVGLLIMAFSATVYAQPKLEFKASGFIDAQSEYWVNVTAGNAAAGIYNGVSDTYKPYGVVTAAVPAYVDPTTGVIIPYAPAVYGKGKGYDRKNAYMETRGRLKFDAVMDKNLSGTIYFEMDASRWGETPGTGDQRNQMGYWAGDRGALEIKNVYFDFGLPYIGVPVPISFRVGLQPLALRANLVVATDGMGVTANINVDPAKIGLLWFKALENADYSSDDVDVYGLHANAKIGPVTAGGYGLYYNMNTYPLATGATTRSADMWWLGIYADGKAGPVDLNFDFVYDRGKVEPRFGSTLDDVKYRGWVTRLKVDYPWEKLNFGVVGMYASGADTRKTSSTGLPAAGTTKVSGYVTPPASESFAVFGESLVFYSSWVNRGNTGISCTGSYTGLSNGGIGGTWMAKLYGSVKATPWYKVTLQGLYIGDTTKHGNTVGTARKADGTLRDDKTIGWEFDLINEFQIYQNLKYTIGGGFMTVGDGLKYWDGTGNDKPKTPWIIASNLTYNF